MIEAGIRLPDKPPVRSGFAIAKLPDVNVPFWRALNHARKNVGIDSLSPRLSLEPVRKGFEASGGWKQRIRRPFSRAFVASFIVKER
jgi:hypothetical protein